MVMAVGLVVTAPRGLGGRGVAAERTRGECRGVPQKTTWRRGGVGQPLLAQQGLPSGDNEIVPATRDSGPAPSRRPTPRRLMLFLFDYTAPAERQRAAPPARRPLAAQVRRVFENVTPTTTERTVFPFATASAFRGACRGRPARRARVCGDAGGCLPAGRSALHCCTMAAPWLRRARPEPGQDVSAVRRQEDEDRVTGHDAVGVLP